MDVSIVIVSWNTRDILRDCLRSICQKGGAVSFEIIVVDNASADDSVAMVRREFPEVRLIENLDNRGFAAANNQGIAVSAGRYVLLLNSDTIVLENGVAETVAFADAHPQAAVVGCRVLNADRTLQRTCSTYPGLLNMTLSSTYLYKVFPRSRLFGREHMTWWAHDEIREVEVVSGCFMLVRREAIERVGVMDDGFFMYAEETDWCYRFNKAGWKVLFTPVAGIVHLGGQSSKRVHVDMAVQLRLSILRFIRKHHGPVYHGFACQLVRLFLIVRLPVWLAIYAGSRQRRQYAGGKVKAYLAGIRGIPLWG